MDPIVEIVENVEEWRKIHEYQRYSVSSMGRIRNDISGMILKLYENPEGYMKVGLVKKKKIRDIKSVHRLVCTAFMENHDNLPQVDHKNRVRGDNRVSNLRWASQEDQHRNRTLSTSMSVLHRRSVWKCDKVTGRKIEIYESTTAAAKSIPNSTKKAQDLICTAANNGRVTQGYKWLYADAEIIEGEEWKSIDTRFADFTEEELSGYQVSTFGRLKTPKGSIRIPYNVKKNQYSKLTLLTKRVLAHRLVAMVFLVKPEDKDIVNHIDGNKKNCKVSNLEWVTRKENSDHAVEIGLISSIEVNQYGLDGVFIKKYPSLISASRDLDITKSVIRTSTLKGKTAGGFQFRVSENNTLPIGAMSDSRHDNHILQYNLLGEYVGYFKNAIEAGKAVGATSWMISSSVKKKGKTCKGFQFRKKNSIIPVDTLENENKSRYEGVGVRKCTLEGEVLKEYKSISEAARDNDIPIGSMWVVANSHKPSLLGFNWVRIDSENLKKRKRED